MEDIKLSVITPTYNSEEFLRDNLESVWNNSQPYEQIIIDANSSDNTLSIIREFQDRGFNIRIITRKPKGISDAMNYGIQKAGSNVIQILHSDDYNIDKDIYEKVRTIFNTVNCKWMYGFVKAVDKDRKIIGKQPPMFIKKYRFWLLGLTNYIPHASLFMKKEIFETYGYFDTNLKIIMDWDYWLRIGKRYTPFVVDEYWSAERWHHNSLSTINAFSKQLHDEVRSIFNCHFKFPLSIFFNILHFTLASIRFLKRKLNFYFKK